MASITIRRLDESTKAGLRIRAAHHGRSMEQEAREILKEALKGKKTGQGNLAESLVGMDLPQTAREPIRKPPKFGG